jgi:hypothetical protein
MVLTTDMPAAKRELPDGHVSITARMLAARRQSARMREHRQRAYHERNLLVAVLSRLWPSHLMPVRPGRDVRGQMNTWNWVVCIHSPEGLLNWHLPNEEVDVYFSHLTKLGDNHWDKHTQDVKWERLEQLVATLARPRLVHEKTED